MNFSFKFLRGSYKNSLSYEKLTHKKFEASTRSSLAPSSGLKIEKWAKKCYFSKTFDKILKLIFLKQVDVKMLKYSLKNFNKSFKAVEQGLQHHQSSQNIAYFQKYLPFNQHKRQIHAFLCSHLGQNTSQVF